MTPDMTLVLVAIVVIVLSLLLTKVFRTPVALVPGKPVRITLREREQLTRDTFRFRFDLASEKHRLGLPVGKHISLRAVKDGKEIQRTYTPVSSDEELGYVDFVIKVYFSGVHPKFPDGGKMSQHLHSLKPGDAIEAIGPNGHMEYKGNGTLHVSRPRGPVQVRTAEHIGMIAGGTGITPMIQLVRAALKDPTDTTKFSLLFANQTAEDIMLKEDLDQIAESHSDRFAVWYTVDKAPSGWKYSEGFINSEMIAAHLPSPGPGSLIIVCGPPPMIKFACMPAFDELGVAEEACYIEGTRSTAAIFQEHRARAS